MLVKNIYTLFIFFLLTKKEILLCFRFGRTAIIYLCWDTLLRRLRLLCGVRSAR